MNSKYIFIFCCFLLSSCVFNLEQKMGAIAYENNCLSNIDIYDTNALKYVFSLKKHESKIGTFIIEQGNHAIDNPPFFIDNGIKKYFLLKIYSNHRYKFIACPENAKPTGDGNWIKLTIRKLEKFKEREIFHKTAEKSTALFVFSGHALGDDCDQGVITRYRKPLC